MLGLLFFLLYINDIVNNLSVKIKLYVDDCILYAEIESPQDQIKLNSDFGKIVACCHRWQMSINYEKTVFMRITLKKKPFLFDYFANNTYISEVSHYKYLGVHISHNLSWSKHTDTVMANCLRKLFTLRQSLKFSTPAVRLLAYNAIVRPTLEYAIII